MSAVSALAAARSALVAVPLAARVCALLAILNAVCWAQITPPFLGPDEADHYAYVQELVQNSRLPSSALEIYSPAEARALYDLDYAHVRYRPEGHPIFAAAQQKKLEHDLALGLSRGETGGAAGVAASEPPLYYMLETIPYRLASSGSVLDRLTLMRLLSTLMGGLTALFAFLFVREALPAVRWTWTVGGLGVALAPLLGLVSGAVNPDAMMLALTAALFYCLARAFRVGLTRGLAFAIGALIALGLVTKVNFAGLVPGAILGLVVLAHREARTVGARAYYRLLAVGILTAVSPVALYGLVNLLSGHPTFGIASSGVSGLTAGGKSMFRELSYIWQFYLPRLPGMHNDFGELFTTRQIWFNDAVGLYGWLDTVFPRWVYNVALIPAGLLFALVVRELVLVRVRVRERVGELVTYVAMSVGVLFIVGAAGFLALPIKTAEYASPRYLLPMLVLWGAVLALAARGAGRRWGPAVGAMIVVLAIAHDLFSQLQVIARYYG